MNGGKIQLLDVKAPYHIHFRDSLNFNPQSLAKWPATFGLTALTKGTFPHRFNRIENWNSPFDLPYPDKEEFGYSRMSEKDQVEFNAWYEADRIAEDNRYEFRREFVTYCSQDVTLLR